MTILIVGDRDVSTRSSLAKELSHQGLNVILVAGSCTLERAAVDNVISYQYFLYVGKNPYLFAKSVFSLSRLIKKTDAAIVHAFDTKPGIVSVLACLFVGDRKVIRTITGLGRSYSTNSSLAVRAIYRATQWCVGSLSSHTIFQNPDDLSVFRSFGACKTDQSTLIYGSGVDVKKYNQAVVYSIEPVLRRNSSDGVTFVCISRMIKEKGILEYMEAARKIKSQYPTSRFLLVGKSDCTDSDHGPLSEIESYNDCVEYLGEREDVPAILQHSDVSVLPSKYREGVPRALIEAAFMNHVIVTTDSPGCKEVIIEGKNGKLVDLENIDLLCEKMSEYAQQTPTELQNQAGGVLNLVHEKFSLERVANQYVKVYRSL